MGGRRANSGPPRVPTETLRARGSWRADERADTEPTFGDPQLMPPKHLSGSAMETWNELIGSIVKAGILQDVDRNILAGACERWGRYLDELAKGPEANENIIDRCLTQYLRHCQELGLTPAARSRVKVEKKSDGKQSIASLVKVG